MNRRGGRVMDWLPAHDAVDVQRKGYGRSWVIRTLWAERCSVAEIAAALSIDGREIARTLRRPAFTGRLRRSKA